MAARLTPTTRLPPPTYLASRLRLTPFGGSADPPRAAPAGFHSYIEAFNRGKRSLTLDLRNPASKDVIHRMLQWADVLTENFRPGFLDSIGYSYEECKKVNPSIIYASNSGFGPEGDWSRNGSMDAVCQAMSGAAVAQGGGPSHEPVLIENCPADQSGAWNFAFSIVSALFHRERTGRGQWLQTSQL